MVLVPRLWHESVYGLCAVETIVSEENNQGKMKEKECAQFTMHISFHVALSIGLMVLGYGTLNESKIGVVLSALCVRMWIPTSSLRIGFRFEYSISHEQLALDRTHETFKIDLLCTSETRIQDY